MKQTQKEDKDLLKAVDEATEWIRQKTEFAPQIAIILGTGLGNLVHQVEVDCEIPYSEIPHFPESTVESHSGKLVFGKLGGQNVVVMQGRFHFYEGYSLGEVTFPVRVVKMLGATHLIVTNAAGGLNLNYRKGELVIIEDHINFMGVNPLIGPNDERLGPRFPDMCEPYSAKLVGIAEETARELNISLRRGVYVGVTGPCLETRAEYRWMQTMGADLVGMSTVPEVIVGVHMGMAILGVSVVTDVCDPDNLAPVDIKEIIQVAGEAGPKLDKLILGVVKKTK